MTRVLLVDDDPSTVARNIDALSAAGIEVSTATTSRGAIEVLQASHPDIVVLEGILDGGWAGFTLARTLARSFPDLPLIMLTRADDVLTPAALARQDRDGGWLPVDRYLEKPVMPEVLAAEIEHVLHGRAVAAGAAR